MIMGEHAVLCGYPAIVCALDERISIRVEPRSDRVIRIDSRLASYEASLDHLHKQPELSFVLAAIEAYQERLQHGFDLHIHSDFSATIGLGSSAAITASMVKLLNHLLGIRSDLYADFRQGLAIIHTVQEGRGSGADLAASLSGGLVFFSNAPLQIKPLPCPESLTLALYYSGYKMKTPAVLAYVEQQWQSQPALLASLYQLMGETAVASKVALEAENFHQLGHLMAVYQGLMDALGVCDQTLADMIYRLRQDPAVVGAKISGSGLGDCVLTLGNKMPGELTNHQCLTIRPASQGVLLTDQVN